jgi:hypothetical protein
MNMLINPTNADELFSRYHTTNRMVINHDLLLANLSSTFIQYSLAGGHLNQDLDYFKVKSLI